MSLKELVKTINVRALASGDIYIEMDYKLGGVAGLLHQALSTLEFKEEVTDVD